MNNKALDEREAGNYSQAEEAFVRALALAEENVSSDSLELAPILMNLASLFDDLGRHQEAESLHLRSLNIRTTELGSHHRDVARSLNNLGVCYMEQERWIEAESLFVLAIAIHEESQKREDSLLLNPKFDILNIERTRNKTKVRTNPDILTPMNNRRQLYLKSKRYDEANSMLQQMVQYAEDAYRDGDVITSVWYFEQADSYVRDSMFRDAHINYADARLRAARAWGEESDAVATLDLCMADSQSELGEYFAAEAGYRNAIRIREKLYKPNSPEVGDALYVLATFLVKRERFSEAEQLHLICLEISEKSSGPNSLTTFVNARALAKLYRAVGDRQAEERFILREIQILEKELGMDNPYLVSSLERLAELLDGEGRIAEAASLRERAQSIRTQNPDSDWDQFQ